MSSLAASSVGSVRRHGSTSGSNHASCSERGGGGQVDGPHGDLSSAPHHHHHHHHHHPPQLDPEWEAKEELRLRELEEARARAAQMEKTMRWWSDCTANWREKWSKVRTERNKVREEVRVLRTKLEVTTKENSNLKRERQELEAELQGVRREQSLSEKDPGGGGGRCSLAGSPCSMHALPERDVPADPEKPEAKPTMLERDVSVEGDLKSFLHHRGPAPHPSPDMEFFDRIFQSSSSVEPKSDASDLSLGGGGQLLGKEGHGCGAKKLHPNAALYWDSLTTPPDIEYIEQRLSVLQMRLDEAAKTIQAEREEKTSLNKALERLQQDFNDLKLKYDEQKVSRQETLKELSQTKAEHQDELNSIRLDLEDEACSRSSMDRRLADLRTQLERLQAENTAEWGKRERLETEKLSLERENKKLRTQLTDLEERLERKAKTCSSSGGEADAKALQHELHDKNKELSDIRHAHSKLKKVLQDKTTELAHAIRRSEQYETEVKKLRCRVEELKKELAVAEDELDSSTNGIRKLQRTNDELQEQVESLQVQVDHLQTRLRNSSHSLLALRGSSSLLNDGLSEDENAEY